ncbi:MAG: FAD-dependent oxidoreductase [Oscillospiraceae bacterium]|nr:FAD-dependent oxidoreductase [Oscillospiraceae bacterium]
MKHVIIGASAAGISAAKTIRKQRTDDEIVIISKDDTVYSRCMLHKYISGERSVQDLSFVPEGFFKNSRIRHLAGVNATGIDTAKKVVFFDGGQELYDKLLIATGAESVYPPIDGLKGAENVRALRDLSDAKIIREKALAADNIVIIGAGLVGLDAAYALVEMGKKPIIVDLAEAILPANLDVRAAAAYKTEFEKAGCVFRLGVRVIGVIRDQNGLVTSVTLDGKEALPCGLLIVAAGVRPAIGFLENSGIACTDSVTVNEYLETSVPDVYAAGDVAGLSRNWPNAVKQGEIAAMNMCGVSTVYDDTFALKNTVNFFGILSLSFGEFVPADGDIEYCRESRGRYEKVILRNGVPVGVIRQGDISYSGFWQYLIKNKINIADIPISVWKLSFADSFGMAENGEYEWTVRA